MTITKIKCPENKIPLKCPNYMQPEFIVVHNTANDASAMAEISYMLGNNSSTSYHYAIDDKQIVQGIDENRNTWHCADGRDGVGNRKGISIEICYSKSGGDRFNLATNNAIDFIVFLLKKYNWGIDKVRYHKEFNNKTNCPHRTLAEGWGNFLKQIELRLAPQHNYTIGNYKTKYVMNVRDGIWGRIKAKHELTPDGQRNSLPNGNYKEGTVFTALEIVQASDGSIWARGYSGYVCIKDKNKEYCEKI